MSTPYDFIVIGSGVSGMTAAALLSKHGRKVALVEKDAGLAPLISGFTRKGAYFDTGFHYAGGLAPGEILDRFLKCLGLAEHLTLAPYDPDGFELLRFPDLGCEFAFPYGRERILKALATEFPREEAAVARYLDEVDAIYAALPYMDMSAEFSMDYLMASVHGESLAQALSRTTREPLLKAILAAHTLFHAVSPERCSFFNHARAVGSFYRSVHGFAGGGLSLARAFAIQLNRLGVDLRLGQGAAEVLLTPAGSVAGVRLEKGDVIEGRGIIATVHPHALLRLVPETAFRPAFRKRLAGLDETFSAYQLFVRAEALPRALKGRSLLVSPGLGSMEAMTPAEVRRKVMYVSACHGTAGEAQGLVAVCPARRDETAAWERSTPGARPKAYAQHKQEVMADMEERLAAAIPELSGRMEVVAGATPLTLRDLCHSPYGSLYGVQHVIGKYNPMPPTRVKGLFLAGQALTGPGLMGAMTSAFFACGTVLGHDALRGELLRCS